MNQFHVIKDPVHGSVQFNTQEDHWIKPFIDHPNFQRLRHIKQLGLTDLIFPGAVHTRFSHNVGCGYVASQICNKLGLSDQEKQMVILACLLHDIGHGPFSHVFEDIFYERCIEHELWTPMFLKEYATEEFLEKFNVRNKKYPLTEEKIHIIEQLITHRFSGNKLLSDIVSSQLDADRLDYLLRDSHFCGVTYGQYDFRWLLHCLTVIEHQGELRLGITAKGIGVVEQYLMARRLMIRNVYQHGRKHGSEFLFQQFLRYLAQGIAEDKQFSTLEPHALIQFLQRANEFNKKIKIANDKEKLKKDFVNENYHWYKQLYDYDILSLIRNLAQWDNDHPAVILAKRLHARKLPKILYVPENNLEKIKNLIEQFKEKHRKIIQPWQMALLHLPHLYYQGDCDPILIQDSLGKVRYLHEDSLMVGAMSDRSENLLLISIDAEFASVNPSALVALRENLEE